MNNYDIAIIGAGKTGRGFIGRLLQEDGRSFLIVDKNVELTERLKNAAEFKIEFFGDVREPMRVKDFTVMHTSSKTVNELLKEMKLIFVSVGGSNLIEVGSWLAQVFEKRLKESTLECSFITCENANKPADRLKEAFLTILSDECRTKAEKLYGFSEATVFCTTIEAKDDPINIMSENYPRLQCDALTLKGNLPEIKGLQPVKDFENFLMRKLFTYNAASAAISYLGWFKGYKIYSDAANDEDILKILNDLYEEVGEALCKVYGYTEEDQRKFAGLSLKKFCDRNISDTIERNAREPQRKLAFNDRIIGPAKLIQECGGDSTPLEITAAAVLLYKNPSDIEWEQLKNELKPEGILKEICRLDLNESLTRQILKFYHTMKDKGSWNYLLIR